MVCSKLQQGFLLVAHMVTSAISHSEMKKKQTELRGFWKFSLQIQ